jgi:hypothetical protein
MRGRSRASAPLRLQRGAMETAAPSYAGTLDTVAAGRTATVLEIRQLADRLEALPRTDVAEVLLLLEPAFDDLRRQAALALERAPRQSAGARGSEWRG